MMFVCVQRCLRSICNREMMPTCCSQADWAHRTGKVRDQWKEMALKLGSNAQKQKVHRQADELKEAGSLPSYGESRSGHWQRRQYWTNESNGVIILVINYNGGIQWMEGLEGLWVRCCGSDPCKLQRFFMCLIIAMLWKNPRTAYKIRK